MSGHSSFPPEVAREAEVGKGFGRSPSEQGYLPGSPYGCGLVPSLRVALSSGIIFPDLTTASVCCSFTALKMFSNNPQVFLSHTIAWLVTTQLNPYLRRLIKTLNGTSHKACSLPGSCHKCPSLPPPATPFPGQPLTFATSGFSWWGGGTPFLAWGEAQMLSFVT